MYKRGIWIRSALNANTATMRERKCTRDSLLNPYDISEQTELALYALKEIWEVMLYDITEQTIIVR